jgi:hypothetical protein
MSGQQSFLTRLSTRPGRTREYHSSHEKSMLDEACRRVRFVGTPEIADRFSFLNERDSV